MPHLQKFAAFGKMSRTWKIAPHLRKDVPQLENCATLVKLRRTWRNVPTNM